MGDGARRDRLEKLLGPVVAADGFDLEDVTVTPAGKRRLVRVVVDRDGGVSLDDVAEVSLSISKELDAADPLGSAPYVLEVTSPGVDRPLTEPRHWRRATGRLVKAELKDGTSAEGRVTGADDSGVELDGTRRLGFEELVRGRVQVEFSRAADLDDDADDGLDDLGDDDIDDEG
ncbi:ribosome maturation factor RimP [Planotetraspora kaengkrachanensis]|uniref:Ribosome maturation factor RimP n=1 Tax=Planotetraspora kaengkrachanensis TaxID=575193 RepID=A0A8J3PRK4_9ACTN|nr:ribosome maturation factor RimP [Planotetraspora kaengkrachanensis]GIG79307.1 ribosome maturation factor RimP [Planotetraspora kaengkrachanensis]